MHGAIGGGFPPGVSEWMIPGNRPEDEEQIRTCRCGCGEDVGSASSYYRMADGERFYDWECVLKFFDVEFVR